MIRSDDIKEFVIYDVLKDVGETLVFQGLELADDDELDELFKAVARLPRDDLDDNFAA